MNRRTSIARFLPFAAGLALAAPAAADDAPARPMPEGTIATDAYRADYVRLGLRDAEGLLYAPTRRAAAARIALVYVHPNGNTFNEPMGPQMAERGHFALMVNYRGPDGERDDAFGPAISQAIRYARSLPGVWKVVLAGHSGGGHLTAWYTNAALNGPDACSGPDKIYPCDRKLASGLERPDGLVLLDPTLGTFHLANAIDPAAGGARRNPALDMFSAANGFEAAARKAGYSPAFVARFNAAQAARSTRLTATALARLQSIERGKGRYRDDEPMVIPGMGNQSAGARLYQPDTSLLAHTRGSHVTLMADGSHPSGQVRSVRPPLGAESAAAVGTLALMTRTTTVRRYLATAALRFGPDFAITADNITGVEWRSGIFSTPGNAEGITVPTLVLTMGCHYLVVPDEIIFEHLAARDKTFMAVEGATHLFQPCRSQYGNTMKRTFDAVGEWLGKEGRF